VIIKVILMGLIRWMIAKSRGRIMRVDILEFRVYLDIWRCYLFYVCLFYHLYGEDK